MSEKMSIHCFVSGLVQGVWFRANTKDQAMQLGLSGWVRNLPDGRVEVLACGEKEQLIQLYQWLQKGPEKAQVTNVSYEELPLQDHDQFHIK